MKPPPFEYKAPRTLDEALALLQEGGSDAKLLAGGQSLVPAMNFRVVRPSVLIDLNGIPDLNYIREHDQATLRIGAMTRERQLEVSPAIAAHAPLLSEAMPQVAHPQIRNRGTLGGSLAHADPAAELPVVMLALDARLRLLGASGDRWVAAADFFTGLFSTALAADEILVEIELPRHPDRTGWAFMEIAPRAGDYALMGVAVVLTTDEDGRCQNARLVYLNAGEGPVEAREAARTLVGETLSATHISEAAELASAREIQPFGNLHATPEFQRRLAHVLTRRALLKAAERAQVAPLQ